MKNLFFVCKIDFNKLRSNQFKCISFKLFRSILILRFLLFSFIFFQCIFALPLPTMQTPNVIPTLKEKVGVIGMQSVKERTRGRESKRDKK